MTNPSETMELTESLDSPRLQAERHGPAYEEAKILLAQKKTWEVLDELQSRIRPGMTEEEAYELAKQILKEAGSTKQWHRPIIRFGQNTVHYFSEKSVPGTILQENDICFVDLGPVFDGHEGDAGTTFTFGHNPLFEKCASDCRRIYEEIFELWKTGATGSGLFQSAVNRASELGWKFNLKTKGHRVADFPHALYSKSDLASLDGKPSRGLWILEIQIRHPELPFGAFHEDLLS